MASSGSSIGSVLIYAFIGFFVGLGLIYSGGKRYLLVQKIKNTPTSKVEGAAVGLTELSGKAECHDPTDSPISAVKCAYWRLNADYYVSGKNGGWRRFYSADSHKQFYLVDETGKMLVDPHGAEIDIPIDWTYQGYIAGGLFGTGHTMDPRVLKFVDTLDDPGKRKFMAYSHSDVRVNESYIADDDPLFVLGSAEPIEGMSSAVAYENLMMRKGDIDKTMYISDNGERKVIQNLSGSMYYHIGGGLALSAICLFFLLTILGV